MKVFRRTKRVRVPEWDTESVTLQEISLGDAGVLSSKQHDRMEFAFEIVGRCLLGGDGQPVGSDWLRQNVGISHLNGLMALLNHCIELNGFSTGGTDAEAEDAETPLDGAPVSDEAGAGARKNSRRTGMPANPA